MSALDSIIESLRRDRLSKPWNAFVNQNPGIAPGVVTYLDGGARPTDASLAQNHYAHARVQEEDARRDLENAPPHPSPPQVGSMFVTLSGSDTTGNGSQASPYRSLFKACSVAVAGDVISMGAGTFVENTTCSLPAKVSLYGTGDSTVIIGSADPLLRIQNNTALDNVQTISGFYMHGQNRTAGTRGIHVQNVRGLIATNIRVESFVGTAAGGGAINLFDVTNCEVKDSTFRNSTGLFADYYTGTFGIGNAQDCSIHDCIMSDTNGMGVKGAGGYITNVEFYNLTCIADNTKNYLVSWPLICFELWNMVATNVTIRNCYFNRTVSLTGSSGVLPAGQYRYKIHNNHFDVLNAAQSSDGQVNYAIEMLQQSMDVHHNLFTGGANPLQQDSGTVLNGQVIHHNIFDNLDDGGYALARFDPGYGDFRFYKNTYYRRQSAGNTGVMFHANAASSPYIYDNIFSFLEPEGDYRWGANALATNWTRNVFYNITTRGTSPVTAPAQPLAVSGGFPAAYVPTGAYTAYGALADGSFAVGIQ